ncbi:hypothetical protein KM043_008241 [Ampulex compressa]|nr:hypothetical protein KM043_008241 [Ampulex compressa]
MQMSSGSARRVLESGFGEYFIVAPSEEPFASSNRRQGVVLLPFWLRRPGKGVRGDAGRKERTLLPALSPRHRGSWTTLNSRKSMNKALPPQRRNNGIARWAGHMRNIWHFSRERERA